MEPKRNQKIGFYSPGCQQRELCGADTGPDSISNSYSLKPKQAQTPMPQKWQNLSPSHLYVVSFSACVSYPFSRQFGLQLFAYAYEERPNYPSTDLLGGSRVVISRVISPPIWVITTLILLITTHQPSSRI